MVHTSAFYRAQCRHNKQKMCYSYPSRKDKNIIKSLSSISQELFLKSLWCLYYCSRDSILPEHSGFQHSAGKLASLQHSQSCKVRATNNKHSNIHLTLLTHICFLNLLPSEFPEFHMPVQTVNTYLTMNSQTKSEDELRSQWQGGLQIFVFITETDLVMLCKETVVSHLSHHALQQPLHQFHHTLKEKNNNCVMTNCSHVNNSPRLVALYHSRGLYYAGK